MNEFKKKIDKFKEKIKEIIEMLNDVVDNINIYYQINYNILNNYEKQNINYEILKNINEIKTNINLIDINKIISDNDINIKFVILSKIYNNIYKEKKILEEFRKEYDLPKIDFSDEDLLNALQKGNYNLEEAFSFLFN